MKTKTHKATVKRLKVTKTGKVLFNFICPEGEQGAQVSEIWLLKDK